MKAIWNGQVLAESDKTTLIEGNHYFPVDAIHKKYFEASVTKTHCPWKGDASYYHLKVGDKTNEGAAWYYPEPSELAKGIKNKVAFWKGVNIIE